MRILLVEDDADLREALGEVIELHNWNVTCAHVPDGASAMGYLEHVLDDELPDLIVLDLSLPVMNGFEFRAAQLQSTKLARIPVLILTGSPWDSALQLRLKAQYFLQKPIRIESLFQIIDRIRHTLPVDGEDETPLVEPPLIEK